MGTEKRSCLNCRYAKRKGLNTIRCMWWKENINTFWEDPAVDCTAYKPKEP